MKQYLKLLMSREGKEVLGKKYSNLWLLTAVLVATFLSIAFSDGSMNYLQYKMEDPFTNWVSIAESSDPQMFAKFKESLEEKENMQKYGYSNVQYDQTTNWNIQGTDSAHLHYLSARCFQQLNSNLVNAILADGNVIDSAVISKENLVDQSLGLILSVNAMKRLGYDEKHLPSYVSLSVYTEGADSLGIPVSSGDFCAVPIPVLAIVKRLPNNVDVMASNHFYNQREHSSIYPFNLSVHEDYLHHLTFYVSEEFGKQKFEACVKKALPDSLAKDFSVVEDKESAYILPWRAGHVYNVVAGSERMSRFVFNNIADKIESAANDIENVRRIHKYVAEDGISAPGSYISIEFTDLSHIRDFELFAKDFGVQVEMAQVASKENFSDVTIMARILSAAMVIFSIICIIMFMVNMLQSYFQKVKRNIGTFKAFGMNAGELILVYTIILILIVISAVAMALVITYAIQLCLPLFGIEKDGFNYLSLWNSTTYVAAAVVLVSTVVTVSVVMIRMLSQTPGDLIYDR